MLQEKQSMTSYLLTGTKILEMGGFKMEPYRSDKGISEEMLFFFGMSHGVVIFI